jgi:hypothetical protein
LKKVLKKSNTFGGNFSKTKMVVPWAKTTNHTMVLLRFEKKNDSLEGFLAPLAPSAEEEIRQRIVDEVHAAGEL